MNQTKRLAAAVDLGSTTIAIRCMDMSEKTVICETSFPNPQRRYGADIMTRIRHCVENADSESAMRDMVWDAFREQGKLIGYSDLAFEQAVISGNSTMLHILRGLPVHGLASAPFRPVSLEAAEDVITADGYACRVFYPPGISAFVGADILSGAAYLGMGMRPEYELLIDLGTNGELLLMNRDHGYATSAACGSVFDHAVSGASYGSECIHAIAVCLKRRLIDENGVIAEPFFEKGIALDRNLVIRQEQVRNFQLAKGAIRTGIACLMREADISAEEIDRIYISGGLGFYMRETDAITVGMFPEMFRDKTVVSGNTSLDGAQALLFNRNEMLSRCLSLRERTHCFEMAEMPEFQRIFLNNLNFKG